MDEKARQQRPSTTSEHQVFYMYAYIFLQILVGNAILRIYVWPHFPSRSVSHFVYVLVTRALIDMIGRVQYHCGTGTSIKDPDRWPVRVLLMLPPLLVDLGLGGCWYECGVRSLARGYCAASAL